MYSTATNGAAPQPSAAPEPVAPAKQKRVNPMKLQQLKDRAAELEEQIASMEHEIAQHELALGEFRSAEDSVRAAGLIEERRAEMSRLLSEWERVSQQLEASA